MTLVLGLSLKTSNLRQVNGSYIGGATHLAKNEHNPKCTACNEYMMLVAQFNHDSLPLAGSMHSRGISRLFICTDSSCDYYMDRGRIKANILQTTSALEVVEDDECCDLHIQERSVASQRVTTEDDEDCTIFISRGKNTTTIELMLRKIGIELKYTGKDGTYFINQITLEDSAEGLKIKNVAMMEKERRKEISEPPPSKKIPHTHKKIRRPVRSISPAKRAASPSSEDEEEKPVIHTKEIVKPVEKVSQSTGTYSSMLKSAPTKSTPVERKAPIKKVNANPEAWQPVISKKSVKKEKYDERKEQKQRRHSDWLKHQGTKSS